jgi:hypothetical protein
MAEQKRPSRRDGEKEKRRQARRRAMLKEVIARNRKHAEALGEEPLEPPNDLPAHLCEPGCPICRRYGFDTEVDDWSVT